MYDKLIYGKRELQNIVSVEIKDDKAILFQEFADKVVTTEVSNKFWILSSKPHDDNWVKLKGNLHYKYGKQYSDRDLFLEARKKSYKYDCYSIFDPKESFLVNYGYTYFKGMQVKDVSILAFDIETTTLEHNQDAKVLLIANTFRRNGIIIRKLFSYTDYSSEKELIDNWCNWVREQNPSVLCGHNIVMFDIPYLDFIAKRANTELKLGRNDSVIRFNDFESELRFDGSQSYSYKKYFVYGREIIDTFFTAIKYDVSRKYYNYRLKSIIKFEGLEVENRQHYDGDQIRYKYKDSVEWEKIKKYAEHDGDDALALFDLMITSFFYITQTVPKAFQSILESASGSQLNSVMVRAYLQEGHSIPKASEKVEFEGAISFGNPGVWKNVFKIDVASLYPSIMLQYEVCDKDKDPNDYFLRMLQTFTTKRLEYKKLSKDTGQQYYDDLQNSFKIFINSSYGFLGSKGLNFNNPKNAAFITEKGREILNKAIQWAENKGFVISNGDTDSISFVKNDRTEFSSEEQQSLLKEINCLYPSKIHFENDGIFETMVILKAKNYILQTKDGKVKYKGSAVKATGKELKFQQFIKDACELLLNSRQEELVNLYHKYVKEILNITNITEYTSKKTITSKVLNPERLNEQKVFDAIEGEEDIQEGNKIKVYFDIEDNLKLEQNWNNDHNVYRLIAKLYKTALIFSNIVDKKQFINYSLKTKRKLLETL